MKKFLIGACLMALLGAVSCSKNAAVSKENQGTVSSQEANSVGAIAIAASGVVNGDSIYMIHACDSGRRVKAISFSTLPATASSYIDSAYNGYSSLGAFEVKDSAGNVKGYIAAFIYNGQPVALLFDADGNFVRVLELRDGLDLLDPRGHRGGCYNYREGDHKDSVALDSLPQTIQSYMSTHYPGDTLLYAYRAHDGAYIVLSKDAGLFVNRFSATGNFVSRVSLPARQDPFQSIDAASLPAAVTTYLTATYPGYVVDKAFEIVRKNGWEGYYVVIDANNTRYGVLFDSTGKFVAARAIE